MSINSSGSVRWLPVQSDVGTHNISVYASDPNLSSVQRFSLNVINVNDAPVITSTPPLEAYTNRLYTYTISYFDEDNDTVSYRLMEAPDGMHLDSSAGILYWRPRLSQAGNYTVIIAVNDSISSSSQEFNLTVHFWPEQAGRSSTGGSERVPVRNITLSTGKREIEVEMKVINAPLGFSLNIKTYSSRGIVASFFVGLDSDENYTSKTQTKRKISRL